MCAGSKGVGQLGCLDLYDTSVGTLSVAALNKFLTDNSCPAIPVGAAAPLPSPAVLAQQAASSFELPNPAGHRSPSEYLDFHGYSETYVRLWTWFWTDPGTWRTYTATARAGANHATVTAKPVSLSYDPGDGSASVVCGGPGVAWTAADGNSAPASFGGCGYQYSTVTGPGYDNPVTSTQTITWQLTWTGSGNTAGRLTSKTTTASGRLNVLQIQTVVTG